MWEYLKDHRKIGLFLVTAAAVEGLVFWLYHLPAAAVAYASVIIAFSGWRLRCRISWGTEEDIRRFFA